MITPRENFIRFLKNEDYDWTPCIADQLSFRPTLIKDNIARAFVSQQEPYTGEFGGLDMYGCDWEYEELVGGSMEKGKLFDDIENWEEEIIIPDYDALDWDALAAANSEYLDTDKIIQTTIYTGLFERLIAYLGFEDAAMALIDEDQQEIVHKIFDILADSYISLIQHLHRSCNVEWVEIHDDWGAQRSPFFSVDTHKEMIIPHLKKIVDGAHEEGVWMELHSCGRIEPLIPALVETGMDTWIGQMINDKHMLVDTYGDRFKFGVELRPAGPISDEEAIDMVKGAYDEWAGKNVWLVTRANFTPEQKEMISAYMQEHGRF